MSPIHRKLIVSFVVLAFLFSPLQNAAQAQNEWVLMPKDLARVYIEAVKISNDYQAFSTDLLKSKALTSRAIALSRNDQVLVVIPFWHDGNAKGAAFATTFDKTTEAVLASAGWATETIGTLHRVRIWINGLLTADLQIDNTDMVVAGWRMRDGVKEQLVNFRDTNSRERVGELLQSTGFKTENIIDETQNSSGSTNSFELCLEQIGVNTAHADYYSCVNNCLASAGVPSYIIAAISIACIPICVISAGAGCIACATLAGAALVGTVIGCLVGCWGR